jgi:hypothetical protein
LCHCASPPKKDLMHIKDGVSSLRRPTPRPRSGFRLVTEWLAEVSPLVTCPAVPHIASAPPPSPSPVHRTDRAFGPRDHGRRPPANRRGRPHGPVTSRAAPPAGPAPVATAPSAPARTPAANATRIAEDCVNGVLRNAVTTVCSKPGYDRRLSRQLPAAADLRQRHLRPSRRMQQPSPTRIPRPPARLRIQSFSLVPEQCDGGPERW